MKNNNFINNLFQVLNTRTTKQAPNFEVEVFSVLIQSLTVDSATCIKLQPSQIAAKSKKMLPLDQLLDT